MSALLFDRVVEVSTSTGTGDFTLAGAVSGHRTFASVLSVAETTPYAIEAVDTNGNPSGEWEVGVGTYSGANTLTRTSVEASSNADAAVDFSAGNKRVWITASAAYLAAKADAASFVTLTDQAAYDALTPDADTYYFIPEA